MNRFRTVVVLIILLLIVDAIANTPTVETVWQLFERGQVARAESLFTALQQHNPKTPVVVILQARLAESQFQPDQAIDVLEKGLETFGPNANLYFELGNAYSLKVATVSVFKKMGIAKKMKRMWRRAIRLNPQHGRAMLSLAQYYLLAPGFVGGDADSAEYYLTRLTSIEPKLAYMGRAVQQQKEKHFSKARIWLKKVLALDSTYAPAYLSLAFTYLQEEHKDSALAVLDQLLRIQPDNPFALNQKGRLLFEDGKLLAARDLFYRALKSDPYLVAAHFYLGRTYEEQESFVKAGEIYRYIMKTFPKHPLAKQAKQRLKKFTK